MGRAAYSWRTAHARNRGGAVDRREIHGAEVATSTVTELEDLPAQPCSRHCFDRSVRGAHRVFKLLYGLVILGHERRQLVGFGVTADPTAEWIAGQVTEAFPWDTAPQYLIRDRDGVYGHAFTKRVRAMGIRDRPITAGSPWQNGYVERLIGSIRRECMDHTVVLSEAHLSRILRSYVAYYNEARTSPLLEQERAGRSNRSAYRANHRAVASWRPASSIRQNLYMDPAQQDR